MTREGPDGPSRMFHGGNNVEFMTTERADRTPHPDESNSRGSNSEGSRVATPDLRHASPGQFPRGSASVPFHPSSLDGRIAKGETTRYSLTMACIEVIECRASVPTKAQVADQAGVSVRLIHYHFRGIPGLLIAAVELQVDRHQCDLFVIPNKAPLQMRIEALGRQRRHYFEGTGNTFRVAGIVAPSHAGLEQVLLSHRTLLRNKLACSFAPELDSSDAESCRLLDMLEQACGWDAWRSLRDYTNHPAYSAEQSVVRHVSRILC